MEKAALTVAADIKCVPQVMAFVDSFLESIECPMKAQMQLDVAVDEIFSNIAYYAYGKENENKNESEHPCTIVLDPIKGGVVLSFIDNGIAYNPLEHEDPDTTLSIEERAIGGLGILMVKRTMDEVCYERNEDKNVLRLTKKF